MLKKIIIPLCLLLLTTCYAYAAGPTITLSGVTNNSFVNEAKDIDYIVTSDNAVSINSTSYYNGTKYEDKTYTEKTGKYDKANFSKGNGLYKFEMKADDGVLPVTKDVSFTLDTVNPVINVTNVNAFVKQIPPLTINVSDANYKSMKVSFTGRQDETIPEDTYTLPTVTQAGVYSLRVTAEDNAGNTNTFSKTYTVDPVVPTVNFTGYEEYTNTAPHITVDVDDNNYDHAVISLTGKEPVTITDKKYVLDIASQGEYVLGVEVVDKAGNTTAVSKHILYDTEPPVVSPTLSNENKRGEWYYDSIGTSCHMTDKALESVELYVGTRKVSRVDCSGEDVTKEIQIQASDITAAQTNDGCYTLTWICKDKCGNSKEVTKDIKANVTTPVVTISNVQPFVSTKPIITFGISDSLVGLCNTNIDISKNAASFDTFSFGGAIRTYTGIEDDGEYKIEALSTNSAGTLSSPQEISFVLDTIEPVISEPICNLQKRPNCTWGYGEVALSMSASDRNLKETSILVNEKEVASATNENVSKVLTKEWFNANESSDGKYNVQFIATDKAGNSKTKVTSFYNDVITPKVTISGIDNEDFLARTPKLTAKTFDNYPCTTYYDIYRNGSKVKTIAKSEDNSTCDDFDRDGKYVIDVYAIDNAGNKSEVKTAKFTKDTTSPQVSLSGASEGKYYSRQKPITATVKELNYDGTKVSIGVTKTLRGKMSNSSFPQIKMNKENYSVSRTFKETGTYKITISAVDKAGNKSQVKTLAFTVDTVKPVVKISGITPLVGYGKTASAKVTFEDDFLADKSFKMTNGISAKVSGGKYSGTAVYSDIQSEKKYDGQYVLTATVKDKAGNVTTQTQSFIVDRYGSTFKTGKRTEKLNGKCFPDLIGENVVFIEKNYAEIKDAKATIFCDGVEKEANVRIKRSKNDGSNLNTYTFDSSNFKEEGIYTFNIKTKDAAGNVSELANSNASNFSVSIDSTPPVIVITGIESGEKYSEAKAEISVRDTIKNGKFSIYWNGELIKTSKDNSETITLSKAKSADLVVKATDACGNTATKSVTGVSVQEGGSDFIFILLAIVVLLAALTGIVTLRRRKLRDDL